MSTPGANAVPPPEPTRTSTVVPIFACPGVKEVPVDHLVFPHGGGFTRLTPCPGRDICLWYAAHDLGGGEAINDLPPAAVLPAQFTTAPFACDRFQEFTARKVAVQRRQAEQRLRRLHVAALVGLTELIGMLAYVEVFDTVAAWAA